MELEEFEILLYKWKSQQISEVELRIFLEALEREEYQDRALDWFKKDLAEFKYVGLSSASQQAKAYMRFKNRIESEFQENRVLHRVHFLKTTWVRYAAAIIVLFGIGAYLWNTQRHEKPLITDTKPVPVKNDILPGQDRAVLTLSNGQQIQLNDAVSETIQDGTLSIENTNGRLIYKKGDRVEMNTMSTPKGGQYQLTLADGTKVWLNAASSITYPTAFTGDSRQVSITGEAYFEVAKDKTKPFHVKTSQENITVLGTQFNVNAYPDEASMKTSLLEGSVRIANVTLKPGQAYTKGEVVTTNLAQDLAWKNGMFDFDGADLPTILRQLERWYDLDINYQGEVKPRIFKGRLHRDLTLMQITEILQQMNVKFRLEGKTLFVE